MRISDWSSYVCSSDLSAEGQGSQGSGPQSGQYAESPGQHQRAGDRLAISTVAARRADDHHRLRQSWRQRAVARGPGLSAWHRTARQRSEEHTSELQSLMRISYAVFCLKKKIHRTIKIMSHELRR